MVLEYNFDTNESHPYEKYSSKTLKSIWYQKYK